MLNILGNPCENKGCGDTCISQGDMAGSCDKDGKCSFDYHNLGCKGNFLFLDDCP